MWCRWLVPVLLSPVLAGANLQVVDGRPVVDGVFVNGNGPYRFLVDTATTMNHMDPRLAEGLELRPTFRTELVSLAGAALVPGRDGIHVAIGETVADNQTFLFTGLDTARQLSSGIQGILGQDFLSHFDYLIDLRAKRMVFGPQTPRGKRAQLRQINGRSLVSTSLGDLVLDSGAGEVVLFGVNPDSGERNSIKTLTGTKTVSMIYRRLIIEGRNVWQGKALAIAGQSEPGVAGLIPLTLFRMIYVSNSEGYLILQ